MTAPAPSSLSSGAPASEASPVPVLSLRNLTISARSANGMIPLVSDLSFDLARGETLCIAGESGSGKSMTSLAIMGLLPKPAVSITAGSIAFGTSDLATAPERVMERLRGDRIAMIFQEPMTSLNPVLTIGRQLTEAIETHTDLSRRAARTRAVEALSAVRIPQAERRLSQYPHELSGGMRQRVMIAMALALRPDVLIADEPTTALDVTVQGEILELLRDLKRDFGTSIILITHDMGVVAEMADRVIVMQRGKMVETGATTDLFATPKADYTRALLAAVPRMGAGQAAAAAAGLPVQPAAPQPPLLVVEDLKVGFDLKGGLLGRKTHRVHAVEGVSFTIRRGETFSLVGESGCGKSTIAKALTGLVPFEGKVTLDGKRIDGLSGAARKAVQRDIQMIFQDPYASLDPRMRVGDLVAEPMLIHGIGTARERQDMVAHLFERVGLDPSHAERYPHEFSGGQRQRICIARALSLKPKLIIADESIAALDVSVQAKVLQLLKDLQDEFHLSYLFISHDMAVVENISDRLAVMYLGQMMETGSRDQVFSSPHHPYTQRLIAAVPQPDPAAKRHAFPRLAGEIPSPVYPVGQGPKRLALLDIGAGHMVASRE
jgi:peptide/nickel transport system ATP-binding protein